MGLTDSYFTSVDTTSYFTENSSEYNPLGDLPIGMSTNPGSAPIAEVRKNLNRGLPSVMINFMEPNKSKGGMQGFMPASMSIVSKLQEQAMGELINVNKTTFSVHAPVIDLFGLSKGGEGQARTISADRKKEVFDIFSYNIKQTDRIAKKAGLKNTPFCIHPGDTGGESKFDSGYVDKDGNPIYGTTTSIIDRTTGKNLPIQSSFYKFKASRPNDELYTKVANSEDGKGYAIFEVTPKSSIINQNNMLLNENQEKMSGAQIALSQLEMANQQHHQTKGRDLPGYESAKNNYIATIRTARSQIEHLSASARLAPQFIGMKDYAKKKIPEFLAKLAMVSLKDTDTHPIIAIENMPKGLLGDDPEELIEWVDRGRNEFVNKLVKQGWDRNNAKKKARQLIGMTLDTGHMNTMKAKIKNFKGEKYTEKDLKAFASKMAKKGINLVHVADNIGEFGNDNELIIGRGNTKIKDYMNILKKHGYSGQLQLEAYTPETQNDKIMTLKNLMGISSPLYSSGPSASFQNVENNIQGLYSMNNSLYSHQLSPQHWQNWGGSFSGLPTSFGQNQGNGAKDSFSGAPTS